MSEHQTSYYEIALTNRQVMTVFVILLLCVVAAFLSGVWFGRQGTVAEAMPRLPGVEGGAVGEDAGAGEAAAGDEIGELGFFSNGDEPAPAETEPPARRAEAPPPAQAPARRPAERAAPAAESGLVIQVFSSNDRDQAQRVVTRLTGGGFPAQLSPVEVEGRTMYRVRVGPYAGRDEAERVAARLRGEYRVDTWITQ